MSQETQEIEMLRRLAAVALAQGDAEKAAAHFNAALTAFSASPADAGAAFASALVTDYTAFAERYPALASGESVVSLLDTFCAAAARENAEPNWVLQFFVIRTQKALALTPDRALGAFEDAIKYFREHDADISYVGIGELFIQYADLLFTAGRYAEVEKILNEGLSMSRARTGA
jgi:hypothetical protein